MANEITASVSLRFNDANVDLTRSDTDDQFDVNGNNYQAGVQNIGTSVEILTLDASFGTPGWAYFKNLDPTNFVEIGDYNSGTPHYFMKLKAGEFAIFRLDVAYDQIACLADTASVDLEFFIVED